MTSARTCVEPRPRSHGLLRERFADGFANPEDLTTWFRDEEAAKAYLEECAQVAQ
jgi:hypothetical protein